MRHGNFSYYEMIYRVGVIYANLKIDEYSGVIVKTEAYKNLDPSEKSAISYLLGLVFVKWACETFLEVSWLMHLDVYKKRYNVFVPGSRRPDLFGLDLNGEWLIAESKGRTGRFDTKAFTDALNQVKKDVEIKGSIPKTKVAAQIFFSKDVLNLKIEDPPERQGRPLEIDVTADEFILRYYSPILELLDHNEVDVIEDDGGETYEMVRIKEWDIEIGIAASLRKAIRERNIDYVFAILKKQNFGKKNKENIKVGRDGIRVSVGSESWSVAQTSKEPANRFELNTQK